MWPFMSSTTAVVALKRQQREDLLKTASTYDAASHDKYLHADAREIVRRIGAKEWTASGVLEAYIARAAHAHEATNCLTEVMFATARTRARALDEAFEQTGKLQGPLHGVPMSFKDQFEVQGYDTTVGFTQWVGKPAAKNAEALELLIAAGVVPFVKTNLPQTMLAFECANPLWGRTLNPHASAYTCGGSSGGEGALLAADGSALGLGSDIGGSLRIPASYCGVYALKPGHGRVPYGGALSSAGGFEALHSVAGPMGRSVADLVVAAGVLFGAPDAQRDVAPLPFREVELPKKLKLGYYVDDGFVKASPANERAVRMTIDALRAHGHECIELDWSYGCEPLRLFSFFASADQYKTISSPLGPDPKDASLFLPIYSSRLPGWLRGFLVWLAGSVLGDTQFASLIRSARLKSVREYYAAIEERNAFARRFCDEIWNVQALDGIIAPVQALPTIPHYSARSLAPLGNSTMQYNVVDHPAGVLPVTRVDPARDALPERTPGAPAWPVGVRGGSALVGRECARVYDVVQMAGVPVGVQVVGRKWEDEKVLAMLALVDEALGPRGFGPGMEMGLGAAVAE